MQKKLLILTYDLCFAVLLIPVVLLLPVRLFRRLVLYSFRSLWSGTPIFYMAFNAEAERRLGINAKSLVLVNYYIADVFDYNLGKWGPKWFTNTLVGGLVFVWACIFCDRLHFYCDRGFGSPFTPYRFNRLELLTYRALGIQVFFWTYGGDVRCRETTRALGEPNCCTECEKPMIACVCNDATQRRNYEFLARHSTAIFAMGDMLEYTPGSRNDLWFWPLDLDDPKYEPKYPDANSAEPLRIVHAPNHRMFKGTRHLIAAGEKVKAQGVPVELVMVEKVPNKEALDIYRSADVVFDQCMIGWHGYFALEGMALGKPVMCFIRKPDEYLCAPEKCPIVNTHRDEIAERIIELANDRERCHELGRAGRAYVEKHFTIDAFAERLDRAYKDLEIDAS
jgi:hypothetical protein